MQVFLDKIKHDSYWYNTSESYDPMDVLKITKKNWLRPEINIAMKQCKIKIVYCMVSINAT